VALVLADFFAGAAGLDYKTIMESHEKGNGFGLIAQACWMSIALTGDDASLFDDILEAKKDHTLGDFDLTAIEVPEGETPTNWGQFKKVVLGSKKAQRNLGEIMSGREKQEQEQEQEMSATGLSGKGKDKDKDDGPSTEPPGKGKNKDKSKGGGMKK